MRITRVTLAFFSVGFLAGSFERAAGLGGAGDLGDPDTAHRLPAHTVAAFVAPPDNPPPQPEAVRSALVAHAGEDDRVSPLAHRAFVRLLQQEPGDGVDPLSDLEEAQRDLRKLAQGPHRLMSLPGRVEQSPMPEPGFVSLPGRDGSLVPGLPASQIVEGLRTGVGPAVAATPPPEFIMPIASGRVTSMWNQGRYHPAIDLAAPLGTPVRATTRKQKVTYAGWRGGYGNLVTTRDPQGREHYYGHLQRIVAGIGSLLEQGDLLGLLGSTGHSTGPHVHYEVRRSGRQVNPAGLLFPGRSVSRGYAWNDTRYPTNIAAASEAEAARATAGVAEPRQARIARNRVARARVASIRRPSARMARRYRTRVVTRYVTQRSIRYTTRYAGRYTGRYGRTR